MFQVSLLRQHLRKHHSQFLQYVGRLVQQVIQLRKWEQERKHRFPGRQKKLQVPELKAEYFTSQEVEKIQEPASPILDKRDTQATRREKAES